MKQTMQRNFDRAASRYTELALAQQGVAERLFTRLPARASRILDLGCGPGHLSQSLARRYPEARVWGLDLSEKMLDEARRREPTLSWLQADASRIPLPSGSLDLIFSNMMLQWCPAPLAVFRELRRVLEPRGRVVLSTLLPGSLQEMETAWLSAGQESRVLPFSTAHEHEGWALEAGFQVPRLSEEKMTFFYPDTKSLLDSVSKIGAGATKTTEALSKQIYRSILGCLEEQRTERGLPLSYRVLLLELSS